MEANVIRGWNKMAVNRRPKSNEPKIPHVKELLKNGEWSGRPCVILGGGPSIGDILKRLDEFPPGTMFAAANQSWKIVPVPQVVYVIDKQLLDMAEKDFSEHWEDVASCQVRVTNRGNAAAGSWSGTCWVDQISANEWGDSFATGIIAANNTGLGIINIVDILAADPILLLGYDGLADGVKANWHDDYPDTPGWTPKHQSKTFSRWNVFLTGVKSKIRAKIFNANPKSRYDAIEKITFEEAVKKCFEAIEVQRYFQSAEEGGVRVI